MYLVTATSPDLPTGLVATLIAGAWPTKRVLIESCGAEEPWSARDPEHTPIPGQRAIINSITNDGRLSSGVALGATHDLWTGTVVDDLERWQERDVLPAMLAEPRTTSQIRSKLATNLIALAQWLEGEPRTVETVFDGGYVFDATSAAASVLNRANKIMVLLAPTRQDIGRLASLVREGVSPTAVILFAEHALGFLDSARAAVATATAHVVTTPAPPQDVPLAVVRDLILPTKSKRRRRPGALEQLATIVTALVREQTAKVATQ
jgi:hypothetical protein